MVSKPLQYRPLSLPLESGLFSSVDTACTAKRTSSQDCILSLEAEKGSFTFIGKSLTPMSIKVIGNYEKHRVKHN